VCSVICWDILCCVNVLSWSAKSTTASLSLPVFSVFYRMWLTAAVVTFPEKHLTFSGLFPENSRKVSNYFNSKGHMASTLSLKRVVRQTHINNFVKSQLIFKLCMACGMHKTFRQNEMVWDSRHDTETFWAETRRDPRHTVPRPRRWAFCLRWDVSMS